MLAFPFNPVTDNYIGYIDAPLEVMLYGDYQSSECIDSCVTIRKLLGKYGTGMRFIFRNFPLPVTRVSSLDAAIAVEAAAMQGMFWEMHDMIVDHFPYVDKTALHRFAEVTGLKMDQYQKNRNCNLVIEKIIRDYTSGIRSGMNDSAAFFINGHRYNGYEDAEHLQMACSCSMNYNDIIH